ncbi:PAS domain-containing sensor histidine kinase [Chryseolinea sp. H1M3-3]|uniref:sensor histidine kinase n=1 Tax=Chryseolinea sp. H1M3-3 TaxID=3034144 RepID=UPI0023EC89C1|nr:PAS domain-containing sensor histidine kinase [Chryseolinea sp. H1M3-3]
MKALFKTIFESAPDAIVVVNQKGLITHFNILAKKMFGYGDEEFTGMEIESLIPNSLSEKHRGHRAAFVNNAHPREMGKGMELVAKRKDGSEFIAEISLSPVSIDDQLFISAAIRDVSEKKEIMDQLKNQQILCSAQNDRLLNFAHIVSHNLRSHASNLKVMLEFLENASTLKEKKDIMTHLKAISLGLTETIKNLNEVASMQANSTINKETLNLKKYIIKTSEILVGDINAKSATINNNVSEEINLYYNPAYLESILLNFMSNSLKYSDPRRKPVITLNAAYHEDRLVLEISDNGLGIDLKKYGKQLFGLHKTFHGNKDARGIGLFITKNQVESLGGKIDVQSDVGKGTTFKIFLS